MVQLRDGMWLPAAESHTEYAKEIYEIVAAPDKQSISLLCPTARIHSRGATLNTPTLTVDIRAQFDGVISLEATHWVGSQRKGPDFQLYPAGRPSSTGSFSERTLQSGSLSVTLSQSGEFGIHFHSSDGKPLTSLLDQSIGFAYSPAPSTPIKLESMRDIKHHTFLQTNLSVGESVHGLGERFGSWNKVGQNISLWNADGGTSSEQAYKNISFWMSSRGYGVFVNQPQNVELHIGSDRCSRVQTIVEGQRLEIFIIYGPTPKDILQRYAVLTGKPPRVPRWSFGLWLTTSFTTSYDESTVARFLTGMKDIGAPVDVFHFDCFWMKAFCWTDFVFDSEFFPDPKGQIAHLKATGLCKKVCVWINPYFGQHGEAFKYAAERGYLVKRTNGDVWQWDLWQAGMGLLDITNPEAVTWFVQSLNKLFDMGVDAIKTDFGERIPTRDVAWYDDTVDPDKMHNYYAFEYNKIVYETLEARYGTGEAVLFARAACAGCQRFPLQWGGDCESTPEALGESIRGGLSIGMSGFTFWSCDIGGFEGRPEPWIFKRWVAMGLLCSHSRLHGSNSYRVPWTIDDNDTSEEGCSSTLAKWAKLKNRLMPYIFSQALESADSGLPLSLRAVAIEFPEDPTSWFLDRQFMLGSRLMVAPIFESSGEVTFYLPSGAWTSFFTNTRRNGPGWFTEKHGFGTLPLYVREGTVLVLGRDVSGPVYDYCRNVEVCLYQTGDEAVGYTVGNDDEVVQINIKNGRLDNTPKLSEYIVTNGRCLDGESHSISDQL